MADPNRLSTILRCFTGLTIEAAAPALGGSAPTVQRDRAFARRWLREAIGALAD